MRPVSDDWYDPAAASQADFSMMQSCMAGIISARFVLMEELKAEDRPGIRRRLERELDDFFKTGNLLASLMKSEDR